MRGSKLTEQLQNDEAMRPNQKGDLVHYCFKVFLLEFQALHDQLETQDKSSFVRLFERLFWTNRKTILKTDETENIVALAAEAIWLTGKELQKLGWKWRESEMPVKNVKFPPRPLKIDILCCKDKGKTGIVIDIKTDWVDKTSEEKKAEMKEWANKNRQYQKALIETGYEYEKVESAILRINMKSRPPQIAMEVIAGDVLLNPKITTQSSIETSNLEDAIYKFPAETMVKLKQRDGLAKLTPSDIRVSIREQMAYNEKQQQKRAHEKELAQQQQAQKKIEEEQSKNGIGKVSHGQANDPTEKKTKVPSWQIGISSTESKVIEMELATVHIDFGIDPELPKSLSSLYGDLYAPDDTKLCPRISIFMKAGKLSSDIGLNVDFIAGNVDSALVACAHLFNWYWVDKFAELKEIILFYFNTRIQTNEFCVCLSYRPKMRLIKIVCQPIYSAILLES